MNWAALVERLARALGVWARSVLSAMDRVFAFVHAGNGSMLIAAEDGAWVVVTLAPNKTAVRRRITTGQTLWLLLEVARGQRLDVGPCKVCEERGGGWEWSRYKAPATRPCPECSEPGPEVECGACDEGAVYVSNLGSDEWHPCRIEQCSDGRVPGPPQPTGRDVREPWAWVLDALPWECWCNQGRDEDDRWCPDCRGYCLGDPAVRAAASVLADRLQAQGAKPCRGDWPETKCCHEPCGGKWGANCPHCHWQDGHRKCRGDTSASDRGHVIAAGLRGECQGCKGSRTVACPGRCAGIMGGDCIPCGGGDTPGRVPCPDCRGLGAVLGAPSIAIEALVVAECEARECTACAGDGKLVLPRDFDITVFVDGPRGPTPVTGGCSIKCPPCGGTGRRSAA